MSGQHRETEPENEMQNPIALAAASGSTLAGEDRMQIAFPLVPLTCTIFYKPPRLPAKLHNHGGRLNRIFAP
jgi:hypothetical protein